MSFLKELQQLTSGTSSEDNKETGRIKSILRSNAKSGSTRCTVLVESKFVDTVLVKLSEEGISITIHDDPNTTNVVRAEFSWE